MMLGAYLFSLPEVSQACLELVASSGGAGGGSMGVVACLFSLCIVAWRRLSWARGSECQSSNSPLCFTFTKCGSSISARSLIHRDHALCVCVPVAILELPCMKIS
jgi:hypothetical protein